MNILKILTGFLFLCCLFLFPIVGVTQITYVGDAVIDRTNYTSGLQNDDIFIFCRKKGEPSTASLSARLPNTEAKSFEWSKYNPITGNFDILPVETNFTIKNLEDGCYQVKITTITDATSTYKAWVLNNYIKATAKIEVSDCNLLALKGAVNNLVYVDRQNKDTLVLKNTPQLRWLVDGKEVGNKATYNTFDPPTKDTYYIYEVTRFGCTDTAKVLYQSIVTKASFTLSYDQGKYNDPSKLEAPLTVNFDNTSENGDPGRYEWFIFKTIEYGKDSLVDKIVNDTSFPYTFEETGTYKLKLVSKHDACTDTVSEFILGTDIQNQIVIEESFIDAPNVFTPGISSGQNDVFAINFRSMKSMKVTIVNRWGRVVHKWEKSNISGFSDTVTESVWDGKIGGRYASTGVYYYVVEGVGRDGKRTRANGFVHLFTAK